MLYEGMCLYRQLEQTQWHILLRFCGIMKIRNKPQYLYVGILIHCYSVKQTDGKK